MSTIFIFIIKVYFLVYCHYIISYCEFSYYNIIMIWIEKYRPTEFEDIVGQDKNIKMIDRMMEGGSLPHLLLHG